MGVFGRDLERVLWHLIGGTRGGVTRARIIDAVRERPANVNQLAERLDLDYTTVQYHVRTLEDNGLVDHADDYGAPVHLSPRLEDDIAVFDRIWEKIDKGGSDD